MENNKNELSLDIVARTFPSISILLVITYLLVHYGGIETFKISSMIVLNCICKVLNYIGIS